VNRFIYYLQVVTANNYKAVANLHNLQITRVHAKSFQSAVTSRFLVTVLNNGVSSDSVLTSLPSGEYPTLNCQLNYNAILSASLAELNSQLQGQSQSQSHIVTDSQSVSQ
jgi:hypothetical protein